MDTNSQNKNQQNPYDINNHIKFHLSEDAMKLFVDFFPSPKTKILIIENFIAEKVKELGIEIKLDFAKIKFSLEYLVKKNIKQENIKVAEGREPIDGVDGWIDILIAEAKDDEKSEDKKSKNYHKINNTLSVEKDQIICKIHQPVEGKNGKNLLGKEVEYKKGELPKIEFDNNVYFEEEKDFQIVKSKIDGFLEITKNRIKVLETLIIKGDVDYHSGDVIGKGSLRVDGNIMNGFNVNLKHDLTVGGYIGDANIKVGGTLSARGGFLGTGSGVIRANGNIDVKFIQKQKLYSRGSLNFTRELLHAKTYVKETIIGSSSHASIVGGYTIAKDSIDVYSLGNEYGSKTIVEVGYDYESTNQLTFNRSKMNDLRKEIKKIDIKIREYTLMKRLNPSDYEKLKSLADLHKKIDEEIKELNQENRNLIKKVKSKTDAVLKVRNIVYPGVKISINRKSLFIKEKITNKIFTLSEDREIIMS